MIYFLRGVPLIRKILFPVLVLAGLLTACGNPAQLSTQQITVYKSATCECCTNWISYLEENSFTVKAIETLDMATIKSENGVPLNLHSCHTALVDGYVVEGHVPVDEIKRLLEERPNVMGIAVAGMPPGSPGMDIAGFENDPFDVVAFDEMGNQTLFAIYP
jgi:hypothetical protein